MQQELHISLYLQYQQGVLVVRSVAKHTYCMYANLGSRVEEKGKKLLLITILKTADTDDMVL